MALLPQTSCIWQAAFVGRIGWNSHKSIQGKAINMCWMSCWGHNKETMEDKTNPMFCQTYFQCYKTRWIGVYWRNDQHTDWVDCLTQEKITKMRYRAATIFVDHFSRLWYILLMTHITSEETVMARKSLNGLQKIMVSISNITIVTMAALLTIPS